MVVGVAVAAVSAVVSIVSAFGAASARERKAARIKEITMRMNAKETEMKDFTHTEEVRRQRLKHDNTMTQAHQDMGASGFSATSKSQVDYLQKVDNEFEKDMTFNGHVFDYEKELDSINAELVAEGAKSNGDSIAKFSAVAGGIASVYGAYASQPTAKKLQ